MAKQFKFTPVHEKFCQHYSEFGNATVAYLYAFGSKADGDAKGVTYNTAKSSGPELLQNTAIAERIEQLKEEFAAQYKQTKDGTTRDLIQAAEEAKAQGQFTAYAKLRDMIIKMCGFYEPDRSEITIKSEQPLFGPEEDKKDNE